MNKTKFGISFGMHPQRLFSGAEIFAYAECAEAAGYDSLWLGDHVAFHGPYPESLTTLAAFAARTERITLGTCVYLLPLRRPAIAAKTAATVDYLSGGRLIFGIGIGGEGVEEFELCGVPHGERGARTDEAIAICRKLWSGEEVSHEGRFWRFGPVRQSPRPAAPGGPPIWVGGRSDAARRRAALLGDGYVSYLFTPERFAAGLDQIKGLADEAGRDLGIEAGRWTPAHHAFFHIDDDEARALERGTEDLSRRYNMDFRGIAEKYLLYGPPDRIAGQIAALEKAGARHFIFKTACEAGDEMGQMLRMGEEIVPEARK